MKGAVLADNFAFAVLLIVETADPRLSEEGLATALNSGEASHFAAVRRAVLQHLPKDVQRLVAVFAVEQAKLLMQLHEAVGNDIAQAVGDDRPVFVRPPPGYIPPTTE